MAFENKLLEAIDESDLQNLIENEVSEGKIVEYKEQLPGGGHDDVREFLADVSSFANAAGGHLIFGIKEKGGIPVEVSGLGNIDVDQVKLRFENALRDSIEPRIPGVGIHAVSLTGKGSSVVIRVPRSWSQPHAVNYQRHWRFYSRNSAGKFPLDVPELRSAFSLSESAVAQIRDFRTQRLSMILSGQGPMGLAGGAKIVLHIVPEGALAHSEVFDISSLALNPTTLLPMGSVLGGWNSRHNLDGILTWQASTDSTITDTYLQVFRNGCVEAVEANSMGDIQNDQLIPSVLYERMIIESLPRFFEIQKAIGVEPPLYVMLSLLGVNGYSMGVNPRMSRARQGYPIDRDNLILPELKVDAFGLDPAEAMKPTFDSVWNAAGYSRSLNYSAEGVWGTGPNSQR